MSGIGACSSSKHNQAAYKPSDFQHLGCGLSILWAERSAEAKLRRAASHRFHQSSLRHCNLLDGSPPNLPVVVCQHLAAIRNAGSATPTGIRDSAPYLTIMSRLGDLLRLFNLCLLQVLKQRSFRSGQKEQSVNVCLVRSIVPPLSLTLLPLYTLTRITIARCLYESSSRLGNQQSKIFSVCT